MVERERQRMPPCKRPEKSEHRVRDIMVGALLVDGKVRHRWLATISVKDILHLNSAKLALGARP